MDYYKFYTNNTLKILVHTFIDDKEKEMMNERDNAMNLWEEKEKQLSQYRECKVLKYLNENDTVERFELGQIIYDGTTHCYYVVNSINPFGIAQLYL